MPVPLVALKVRRPGMIVIERDPFDGESVAVHHSDVKSSRAFILVHFNQAQGGHTTPVACAVGILEPCPVTDVAVDVKDHRLGPGRHLL